MVGRDVGQDARVVRLVADAAQDDPAARGLEDGHVDVAPGEDLVRAARAGPVARVDHPLVDEHAVRGRRPDVAAGPQQDVGDQPGDRALAVRARDRHDRDASVARRVPTRAGSPVPRRSAPSSGRAAAPGRRSGGRCRDGDTSRSASASAASVRASARSAPTHGKVTIQCPGSDERWTARPPRPSPWSARSRRIQATTVAATGSGQSRAGHGRPEVDQRVAPGIALPVPGPAPPDGDLELDHRLQPVDVGAFEEAGLDQSHGPGRIASRHAARLRRP